MTAQLQMTAVNVWAAENSQRLSAETTGVERVVNLVEKAVMKNYGK